MDAHNYSKSFTLVEILVAAVILTFVAGGLFSGFVISKRYVRLGYRRLQALGIARQYLEGLRSEVNATTWNDPANNTLSLGEYILLSVPKGGITFNPSYNVSFLDLNTDNIADDNEPRKVTFSVSWQEPQ